LARINCRQLLIFHLLARNFKTILFLFHFFVFLLCVVCFQSFTSNHKKTTWKHQLNSPIFLNSTLMKSFHFLVLFSYYFFIFCLPSLLLISHVYCYFFFLLLPLRFVFARLLAYLLFFVVGRRCRFALLVIENIYPMRQRTNCW
jgi:hypothetical protein